MFTTASETEARTTTRLLKAWDAKHPVTITYTKADGTQTIRTIEIYDVKVTKAGDVILKAMDRNSGESRTFRLDRISHYTIHRTAYTVPRDADTTIRPLAAQPATVTPLTTAPAAVRITALANQLAA